MADELYPQAAMKRFSEEAFPVERSEVVPWPEEHRVTIGQPWYCPSVTMITEVRGNNVCLHYGVLTTTGEDASQSEEANE